MNKKTAKLNKRFEFLSGQDQYVFQLKKRNWLWLWILLALLLLLLLCVRCEREIEVTTVEKDSEAVLSGVDVNISYNDYYIFKKGHFFGRDKISASQTTDDDGKAVFSKLPCSVFSYVFACLAKATYNAKDACHELNPPAKSLFHFTKRKRLELEPYITDIRWTVVDSASKNPIAGALVEYEYMLKGKLVADSAKTDAAGQCVIKGVPKCGQIKFPRISAYAYKDATDILADVPDILDDPALAVTELDPELTSFTVFVKNKVSRQPIPNATVTVKISSPSGHYNTTGHAVTNGEGKTRGAYGYEDGALLYYLSLHAERDNFKPGDFEYVDAAGKRKDPYTVADFIALADSLRVIYLEPLPFVREFQNIDSISGAPVPNAVNVITVTGADGKSTTTTAQSNIHGYFNVRACEGDKIHIESSHPDYEDKITEIPSFDKDQKIKMHPRVVSLDFRTIEEADGSLVPNCRLEITGSRTGANPLTNSGTGEFTVHGLFLDEELTILAYDDEKERENTTKIVKKKVRDLMASSQDDRDIPFSNISTFKADIVLCIDCTGSMGKLIGTIRRNASNLSSDLLKRCEKEGKRIESFRIKVCGFRDVTDFKAPPFEESRFFKIPDEQALFTSFVSRLQAREGGDDPESGYEAIKRSIESDWATDGRTHQVIILWTDAESRPIAGDYSVADSRNKLLNLWTTKMSPRGRRLIIFSPNDHTWAPLEKTFDNTTRRDVGSGRGLSDLDYNDLMETISVGI